MTVATLFLFLAGALLSPTPADADHHGRAGSHAADTAFSAPDALPGSGFIEVEGGATSLEMGRTPPTRIKGHERAAFVARAASAFVFHLRTPSTHATRRMLACSGRLSAPPTAPPVPD